MKRNNAEQIGELIRHYLRQESLESPLNERRLISAWPEVLLVRNLNRHVGAQVITNIIFR